MVNSDVTKRAQGKKNNSAAASAHARTPSGIPRAVRKPPEFKSPRAGANNPGAGTRPGIRPGARTNSNVNRNTAASGSNQQRKRNDNPELDRKLKEKEKIKSEAYKKYAANLRRSKFVRAVFLMCMMFILISVLTAFIYEVFFKITEIKIVGLTKYSEKQIISASGTDIGKHLYSFNSREAAENITMYYPYIESVTITRSAPDKVIFTVVEETAYFYASIFGEYYLFSESMRVLGAAPSDFSGEGLIKLKLPLVNYAVAGSDIGFLEIKNEKYIKTAASETISSPMLGRINIIDLRDKYNMTMVADNKYRLIFGTVDSVLLKLKLAEKVFQDTIFTTGNKAIVDLTKLNETSVIIDNTISLD